MCRNHSHRSNVVVNPIQDVQWTTGGTEPGETHPIYNKAR
jgi:hypothetical protein